MHTSLLHTQGSPLYARIGLYTISCGLDINVELFYSRFWTTEPLHTIIWQSMASTLLYEVHDHPRFMKPNMPRPSVCHQRLCSLGSSTGVEASELYAKWEFEHATPPHLLSRFTLFHKSLLYSTRDYWYGGTLKHFLYKKQKIQSPTCKRFDKLYCRFTDSKLSVRIVPEIEIFVLLFFNVWPFSRSAGP